MLKNSKWDTAVIDDVKKDMASNADNSAKVSSPEYMTIKINNRRHLGNKYKLCLSNSNTKNLKRTI